MENHSAVNGGALASIRAHWISNVVHDLRGPLFAARGYTKLMLDSPGEDVTVTHQRYLRSILENINKLTELVDGLQYVPTDDALQLASLSFRELLRSVIDDWRQREKLPHIEEQIPAEPMHTIGDHTKLALAMHKLLGSAVEFTQYGGKVEVRLHQEDDEITVRISATSDANVQRAGRKSLSDVSIPCAILRLHGGTSSVDCGEGAIYRITCRLPVIG